MHAKFELSRCPVCPTIELNICSILLIKKCLKQTHTHTHRQTIRLQEHSRLTTGVLKIMMTMGTYQKVSNDNNDIYKNSFYGGEDILEKMSTDYVDIS